MIERPNIVRDEHLTYLDKLRDSGATNMFGAGEYLMRRFPKLGEKDAGTILIYWMNSFAERHPQSEGED